ncbi:MAG: RluA family pseudouridine synthase [Elusimicrobia bacterium]|nr:RluA family pseudouridine synthase [Elusimicrobiota bacterium]
MDEILEVTEPGLRLDRFLALKFPDWSRGYCRDLIARGLVHVGAAARPADYRLSPGETVALRRPDCPWRALPFEKWILFEDSEILVVNKPAGLLMHPIGPTWLQRSEAAATEPEPNVAGLLYWARPKLFKAGLQRLGLVHRLDRQTSGALVVAKTARSQEAMIRAFSERRVEKAYRAIVAGKLEAGVEVDAPVGRPSGGRKVRVTPWGREAVTWVRAVQRAPRATLVEARPRTGRTHQIRAHLTHIGHPVLGDPEAKTDNAALLSARGLPAPPRLMLHAWRISFAHPSRNTDVSFSAPAPKDFRDYWALVKKACLLIAIMASGSARSAAAPESVASDPLNRAMRLELRRSFERLRKSSPPLYYLDYEVYDIRTHDLVSSLGVMKDEWQFEQRRVDVDARVGAPRLDNTHELKGFEAASSGGRARDLPIAGDEAALRAGLWLRTEEAYREAQEKFEKVRTDQTVRAMEEDRSSDFSQGEPVSVHREEVSFPNFPRAAWRERLKRYSRILKEQPFVHDSNASLSVRREIRSFLSSEGTDVRSGTQTIRLSYYLRTRTEDGMDLWRYVRYFGGSIEEMPGDEIVLRDIRRSVGELDALRRAPTAQPYSGPVILKNEAAGTFFHESLGHRVERQRQKSESEGQTFKKKLGEKITSEILSVYDDPSLDRYQGVFLNGHYRFDDEGMPSRRVAVVERGVLKDFLMDRTPIDGFPRSNGHGRREPGYAVEARQGNLIIEANRTVAYPELRRMLLEEVRRRKKPYGLIFEDIEGGGHTFTGRSQGQSFHETPLLVYRVYPDGRPDEAVRGVNIVGTPLSALEKIVAAADDYGVDNAWCGSASGTVPISIVSPSLLLSELEVEKAPKSQEKPPILKPPFHDRTVR